ncbi:MAG TPA: (2Fe-2S) ferredoxin domain-containing protein [Thermoanaerobaculia bacterium]|jgi:(2Fe-2S) ferredoxin|nr:(2Fe-2S) ferredoxin domain-containing protein [Thermoanaerobaculia bacterium]
MKYPFEKLFLVCTGKSCNDLVRGDERGEIIRQELKDHNKSMGRKPTVRVCAVSCLDMCDYGPNMVVQPSGDLYSGLNRSRARAVYDAEMGDA